MWQSRIHSLLSFGTYVSLISGSLVTAAANNTYDYVIVGGGLSGLVVANRLTENPSVNVLVVEFGYIDRSNSTTVPYYANDENYPDLFNITSAPEPYLLNETITVLAGATLGGGSVVNGMEFDRASAADYNSWEQLGNPGWGWDSLFGYFKKSTTFTPPIPSLAEDFHMTWDSNAYGKTGPLQVSFPKFQYPDIKKFWAGLKQLGAPYIKEGADGDAVGVFWTQNALDPKTETRSDALTTYYDQASNRTNLHVILGSQVTEIMFSSNFTAQGVKIRSRANNSTSFAYASKEVVLAAGAVHTPQILQWSGLGPKDVLEAAGVTPKMDFPAIGANFQDHPVGYLDFNLTNASFPNVNTISTNETFNLLAIAEYDANRTGPYTEAHGNSAAWLSLKDISANASSMIATIKTQNASSYLPSAYTNAQLLAGFKAQRKILVEQFEAGDVAQYEFPFSGGGLVPNALQKPLSRGTVYLNASDPYGEPVVTHYALMNPFDKATLLASFQYTRKVFNTSAVQELGPVELLPGPQYQDIDSIIAVLVAADAISATFAHPSCSCPMMPNALGGVVSSELLVYGTSKLSIVDASIMPLIPAAHLQSTVYAIAEKAADIIKSRQ